MKKIIIALILMFAFSFAGRTQNVNSNDPEMKLDKLVFDYGTLTRTDKTDDPKGDCVFKVTNNGKIPLIISKCTPSCGCTTPGCPQEPIMPGKTAPIKIHYNANKAGTFSKTVTIFANASNSPLSLTIKGNVVENIGADSK